MALAEQQGYAKLTDVTSVISHQLKTPLAGMKSSLEVLLAGDLGEISKEQKEYIQLTLGNVNKMILLVKDLLDVSRIDEDRFVLKPEKSNVVELVKDAIGELSTFAQAKNTEIVLDAEPDIPPLTIDAIKIKQVIDNILYNAIRYNKGKGRIEITLKNNDGTVLLSCKDNGVGISEEDKKMIFNKYYRSPRVISLAPDGTGLGLYISKAIIEKSGGTIWFESLEGKGTIFYFTLPAH